MSRYPNTRFVEFSTGDVDPDLIAARARVHMLEQVLAQFGQHDGECNFVVYMGGQPCDCGWTETWQRVLEGIPS